MRTKRVSLASITTALVLTLTLSACGGGSNDKASSPAPGSGDRSSSSAFCDDFKKMNDSSRDPGVDNFYVNNGTLDPNDDFVNDDAAWFDEIIGEAPDAIKADLGTMQAFNAMIKDGVALDEVRGAYDNADSAADNVRTYLESNANTCVWP